MTTYLMTELYNIKETTTRYFAKCSLRAFHLMETKYCVIEINKPVTELKNKSTQTQIYIFLTIIKLIKICIALPH